MKRYNVKIPERHLRRLTFVPSKDQSNPIPCWPLNDALFEAFDEWIEENFGRVYRDWRSATYEVGFNHDELEFILTPDQNR